MDHPFAERIGLHLVEQDRGSSLTRLAVAPGLCNPQKVLHGAVLYALADTGMGGALYPLLEAGEYCATIEIKIAYFRPVASGSVECRTNLIHRGRTIAHLESTIDNDGALVARATGSFAIFRPSPR